MTNRIIIEKLIDLYNERIIKTIVHLYSATECSGCETHQRFSKIKDEWYMKQPEFKKVGFDKWKKKEN